MPISVINSPLRHCSKEIDFVIIIYRRVFRTYNATEYSKYSHTYISIIYSAYYHDILDSISYSNI